MEDTKEFIIDKAFKLFLAHNYEGVSISQLSSAIGMTKGALYHHFKNKEEIFKSVVDKYLIFPGVIAEIESVNLYEYIQLSIAHAEKIIRSLFKNTYTPFDFMSLSADAFRHYPGYTEIKVKFINKEIEKTKIVLKNAIKSGEIRKDINVSIVASNFLSFNMGLAGSIVRNYPIEDTINTLREQNFEYYKLLKSN